MEVLGIVIFFSAFSVPTATHHHFREDNNLVGPKEKLISVSLCAATIGHDWFYCIISQEKSEERRRERRGARGGRREAVPTAHDSFSLPNACKMVVMASNTHDLIFLRE